MKRFVKNEIVLILSFILALLSCCMIFPQIHVQDAIDFKTLAVLFCLMLVMEGLKKNGVFHILANQLLRKVHTVKGVSLTLVLLCFFSSMLITNDVALITFVPFTIMLFSGSDMDRKAIWVIVLETVAANLGSMMTPVGNPQNLYLFSEYNMTLIEFCAAVYPYACLSLLLLIFIILCTCDAKKISAENEVAHALPGISSCLIYAALFLLCVLTVFHVIPYPVSLVICTVTVLLFDKHVFRYVDYSLLLTFVFLFIFIGNLGNISYIDNFLSKIIVGREVPVAISVSQIFSNVPTAILLSGFTENGKDLLIGTNLGGLGTLIASMASLISFKYIAKEKGTAGRYLIDFTLVNIFFLICNIILWLCIL